MKGLGLLPGDCGSVLLFLLRGGGELSTPALCSEPCWHVHGVAQGQRVLASISPNTPSRIKPQVQLRGLEAVAVYMLGERAHLRCPSTEGGAGTSQGGT